MPLMRNPFLVSETALRHIKEYKYSFAGHTFLDTYVMGPFWQWAVNLVPMWMAPNLVTLIGLIISVSACLNLAIHCPDLRSTAPAWANTWAAIALFLYQTLDAVDGKQARRTNSSSPLGQLFDHGCDALNMGFIVLATACSLDLGATWLSLLFFHLIAGPFLTGQWEEYHTGTMRTGNSVFGVTEGQFGCMLIFAATGYAGPELWYRSLPLPLLNKVTFRGVILAFLLVSNSALVVGNVKAVFTNKAVMEEVERGHKALGRAMAIRMLMPYVMFAIATVVWDAAPSQPFQRHPLLMMLCVIMLYTLLVTMIIVGHMTKSVPFSGMQPLAVLTFCVANSYAYWVPELYCLWGCLAFTCVWYLTFVTIVVRQICRHLGIYCFSLKRREKAE